MNLPSPIRGIAGRTKRSERRLPVRCQICGAPCEPGLDLGHQPVGDLILSERQLNQPETCFPMQLFHCPDCGLTQLGYIVNPKVVYRHFPFVSGTTQTATRHLQSLAHRLVDMLNLGPTNFVIDIGSNDGTLLKGYLGSGVRFVGVDPAGDPVQIANDQGLTTLHAFFNAETARYLLAEYGQADAITACGVFAHIADLTGVMEGVTRLLKPGGVFATDSQYWLDMVERLHYDNVFHQHLRYYSLRPLNHLFRQYGLELFDVERSDVYGGSIRIYAGFAGEHPITPAVAALEAIEQRAGLYQPETHVRFSGQVAVERARLFDSVYRFTSSGKKVIGIGAPAKAATICNYCDLGPDRISYVTEVNPLRIGKYLPGRHIPIVDEAWMFEDPKPADAAILFAWNYADEIIPKLRRRGFQGEILRP